MTMTSEESAAFKKLINPSIDLVIAELGGIAIVCKAYEQMPGMIDFIAGWAVRELWGHKQGALQEPRMATHEEMRRVYDLVRLRLDTGSSTS